MKKILRAFSLLFSFAVPSAALAEPAGIVSEVKLGVLAHDLRIVAADPVESGVDINGEVLFTSPAFLEPLWAPRPHIGAQVNTSGGTSQIYAGFTWTFDLTDRLWLGLAGGGAVHNGEALGFDADRKTLGSNVLFRLSAELGVDLTERLNVSIYYDHISNAFIARENPGLDNLGMRIGWRF